MLKWILIVVGVVAIVVVGAVFLLVSNVDSIAKAGVEKYASEAVKANVTLQEVTISTTSGEGSLRGLKVGNPQGFNTESAIEFGEVSVALDVLSLASDTVVIKSVVITAPQVTYEIGAAGSNIDALRKNVADYTGASPGSASTAAASGGAAAGEGGRKLVIENLYVRDGSVNVSATFLKGKKLSAPLPNIHLKDIGKDGGGASPAEVAKQLVDALAKESGVAVTALDLNKLTGAVGKAAAGAVGAAIGAATGAGGAAGAVGGAAGTAAGAAKKGAEEAAGAAPPRRAPRASPERSRSCSETRATAPRRPSPESRPQGDAATSEIAAMQVGSSLRGAFTWGLTGYARKLSGALGLSSSRAPSTSQRAQSSGSRATGMRSCRNARSSLRLVVMIA